MHGKPIKVLHFIPTLMNGGAERQLVNLVNSTSREVVEHVVCVISQAYAFAPFIRRAGYKVIDLDIRAKRPFFRAALKFRRVINEENPDIIHSWLYDANISARLAVLANGRIPIVTSLQLPDYEPEAIRVGNWNPYKVRSLKAIDKLTAMLTKPYFAACSKFVKDSYQTHYGIDENRIEFIYNSVDPDLLVASDEDLQNLRRELALPPDAFIYLNVGRLDPQKNHKILFEAFRQTAQEIPNAFLLLAGVGATAMENDLKKLAEDLQINEKVLFLGRRNDIGALLEFADVFVFPSSFEGLGVALVEAMFNSLPFVVSRIKVFQEFVIDGETGLLIDQTSPAELKDAMVKLYKNEDLRRSLGEKALRCAESMFHVNKTARQWEELYRKVLSKSGKSV